MEDEVHCYLNGIRWDAESGDISAGGMFLVSEKDIPVSSMVALVLKPQVNSGNEPVFLLGRVVRKQLQPVKGVGLRWEKAIQDGPPEMLAAFLESFMKFTPGRIELQAVGRKALVRAVYTFECEGEGQAITSAAQPTGGQNRERNREMLAIPGLATTLAEVDELDIRVVSSSELAGEIRRPLLPRESSAGKPESAPGPITERIDQMDMMAPADIGALLGISGKTLPVRIGFLGLRTMFVMTEVVPADRSADVTVSFGVMTRGGIVQIQGSCRVAEVDDGRTTGTPGLEVRVLSWDEAGHPGILRQYVKWLHFDALSRY